MVSPEAQSPPIRFGRSITIRICAVTALVLSFLALGTVFWRHRSEEKWYRAGIAAISRGDIVTLKLAVSHLPADSPRARLLQGAIELRNHRPDSALRVLKPAVDEPETALRAKFLAGEALCHLQDYEVAMHVLRDALEQEPGNVDGRRWLAVAAYEIGAAPEALEQLRRVAELDPQDPRAHRTIGLIFTEAEEFPQAIDAYQTSLKRSRNQPDLERILQELAFAQLRVHRYQDVLVTLDGSIRSPELDSLRAEALYALGNSVEAKELVEHVLRRGQTFRALVLQGLMKLDDGHPSEAIEALQQAVKLQPSDFETRAKLTQAFAQAGDTDAARRELAEFERIKGIRAEIHELTLQAANQPQSGDTRYELGIRYRQLGLDSVAGKWFRAALALDPAHDAARKALSSINSTSGRS